MTEYVVIVVDFDLHRAHVALTLSEAYAMARPGPTATVEVYRVKAHSAEQASIPAVYRVGCYCGSLPRTHSLRGASNV